MEAQINQNSSQNAAQKEKVVLFNHFYEKLAFFLNSGSNHFVVLYEIKNLSFEWMSKVARWLIIGKEQFMTA